jgi:uncharacterized membrane protein YphA (DoxX/SURF4 family)
MTRLSKDMSILDLMMPRYALLAIYGIIRTVTVFATVMFLQPLLVVIVAFFAMLMMAFYFYAVPTMMQSQRMDSLYRGPLNSGMQNLVIGLISIRAYEKVDYFRKLYINRIE